MTVDATTLRAADAYCRALLAHYENFTVASRLSSPALRRDLARFYAFCRTTDDLGDESGDSVTATKRLERWRSELRDTVEGAPPSHPVLIALHDTLRRHDITHQHLFDLIDANLQDQRVHRYEDWASLRAYCLRSAAPVGRIVLEINRIRDERARSLSDDVCIGLQLANFAQDVARDAERGRTYLLQSDIRQLGGEGAVRSMCARARVLLDSGRQLEQMVHARLRLQLRLYRLGGIAILDAVARTRYATAEARPVVNGLARMRIAARALVPLHG